MRISIRVGVRRLGQHRLADSGYSANRGWGSDPFYTRRGLEGAVSSPAWTILFLPARLGHPSAFAAALGMTPPGGHTRQCLSPPAPVEGAVTALILHSNTPAARMRSNLCEHWACAQRWIRSSLWRRGAPSCTSQSWLTGDPWLEAGTKGV